MAKSLVIVESPTKAKTISKYLGKDFYIESSAGHIKNLPESKLGIDVENGYVPEYVTIKGKADVIKKLVEKAGKSDQVYIATDPDREGEAIAWHIAREIKKKASNVHRVMFHEITKEAVKKAIATPGKIDEKLVEAQQARRVMDRIVGYQVSPFLWKAVYKGLSAGRVQTVALRLLCEREREIADFTPEEFWSLTGTFLTSKKNEFLAKLHKISNKNFTIKTETDSKATAEEIKKQSYEITSVEKKEVKRNPGAPFITSTIQQEASIRLRFTTKRTMMIAQQLYEGIELDNGEAVGLITYMRTDSVRVSDEAVQSVREYINSSYGKEYLPKTARVYKTKKSAQDAHEAIRPTSLQYEPKKIKKSLTDEQFKLYSLIWNRFVASQMESAVFDQTTVDITGGKFTFRAVGSIQKFSGFLAVYEDVDEKEVENDDDAENAKLPAELAEKQKVDLKKLAQKQHFTKAPPRYSEASLVKELEANGIGRPSTYSGIIATLTERKYAELKERRFHATQVGLSVNDILIKSFPHIFDYDFTAKMEDKLDGIAEGNSKYIKVLDEFYHPLQKILSGLNIKSIKKSMEEETDEKCPKCGSSMIIKWGRNGKFMACSNYPECKSTRAINADNTVKEEPKVEPLGRNCPTCGNELVARTGRFGRFIACSTYPKDCKYTERIIEESKIIMPCPKCGENKVSEKRSKKGKIFFGCNGYPKCDFALWDRPVLEPCPKCKNTYLLLKIKKGEQYKYCNNETCDFRVDVEAAVEA